MPSQSSVIPCLRAITTNIHTYSICCCVWQVIQLTGFSDPVYSEAYVIVNQFDIVLDVLIVNQTSDTLQGLTLELATLGEYTSMLCTIWK